MDWLDLLAVQGTLKNLLQHNSSKASSLRCSAFFIVTLWGNLKLCLVMFSSYLDDVWCCLFANSDSEGEYQCEKFYCTFHPQLVIDGIQNPRDGRAWWAAVYGVAQSWTRLKRLSSSSSSSIVFLGFYLSALPRNCWIPPVQFVKRN